MHIFYSNKNQSMDENSALFRPITKHFENLKVFVSINITKHHQIHNYQHLNKTIDHHGSALTNSLSHNKSCTSKSNPITQYIAPQGVISMKNKINRMTTSIFNKTINDKKIKQEYLFASNWCERTSWGLPVTSIKVDTKTEN